MTRGDHLYVRRRPHYSHHGIDCGDGTVIHYVGPRGATRRVERTSYDVFADGDRVRVRAYKQRLPVEEIVRNAESKLGELDYSLVRNNCEHLATWSSTGSSRSRQVRRWTIAAPGALASASVADAGGLHMVLLGSLGMGLVAAARPRWRRGSGDPVGVGGHDAQAPEVEAAPA